MAGDRIPTPARDTLGLDRPRWPGGRYQPLPEVRVTRCSRCRRDDQVCNFHGRPLCRLCVRALDDAAVARARGTIAGSVSIASELS